MLFGIVRPGNIGAIQNGSPRRDLRSICSRQAPTRCLQLRRRADTGDIRVSAPELQDLMIELLGFLQYLISLYVYVVLAVVIVGWLLAFNVINGRNNFVQSLWYALNAVTEPVLAPIRRMLPNLGAVDISPIVLLVGLEGIRSFLIPFLARTLA
jgi:YggT family protein